MENQIVFMHSPDLDEGGYPEECPFNSKRGGKTLETASSLGLLDEPNIQVTSPRAVTVDEALTFHTQEYIDMLREVSSGTHNFRALKMGLGTPDCPVFKDMLDFSLLASGGTLSGARLLIEKKADIVFNPHGGFHHAHPGTAGGFCYINDVVIAAKELVAANKKVVVLDLDAHHLDGVQDAFYDNPDVTTISMHESGKTLFPGTGHEAEQGIGKGKGHTVNIPLPVGTFDEIYKMAFMQIVVPLLDHLQPDVIILELGMDGLATDPLAHLNLTNNVYAELLEEIVSLNVPLLTVGGGGYNVQDTVRSWALCWSVLSGTMQDETSLMAGMGGVMLQNTAWFGGLRDRTLLSHGGYRGEVEEEVQRVVQFLKDTLFPIHDL
ncbi:MAG: acetoin utilization protein AcuC [Deltaproteobacteria bacterium]|nr:acetoin utilization protein AcuC [Deltaproteobacteria bacterium]MBN2674110.1 acetoin utilization protein AcuC [Deltaproteobacteria bacterium]